MSALCDSERYVLHVTVCKDCVHRVAQDWVYEFQQQSVQQVARDITENVSDPDLQATEVRMVMY